MSEETKIKELEAKVVSLEVKIKELKEHKKYGLIWEPKIEKFEIESKDALPILKEKDGKFKDIITTKEDGFNILIEGDNYHALSVLSYTHRNKIDVIYIDPPYNTGNKDFKYNDYYVDKEDRFRHSKWLSFMEKRLKLAKALLKKDGVIFISIDDNEVSQLTLLCDKIFGENNFINNISVKSSETSGVKMSHTEKKLPKIKEYLLVYARNISNIKFNPIKIPKSSDFEKFKKYAKYYSKIIENPNDEVEKWRILTLKNYFHKNNIRVNSVEELIKFKINNAKNIIYRTNNATFSDLSFKTPTAKIISATGLEYVWWEGKQMLFLSDYIEESICDLWTDISTINLNKEMAGLPSFSNGQKPIMLIQRILKLYQNTDALVLDFFAGSGTTGHSVLDLNNKDKGNRKFILCTNNENKICEKITHERIRRVIEGYRNKKERVIGLGGNLKYLKTDFVKLEKSIDTLKYRIVEGSTEIICLKENSFGLVVDSYKKNRIKIFQNKDKYTAILFDLFYFDDFINELKKLKDKPVSVYVFSYAKDFSKKEFGDLDTKFTIEPIPENILETYKKIFNF